MVAHNSLADSVLTTLEIGPKTANTGTTNGTGVDMQGWEGVMFVVAVGAITGSGKLDGYVDMDDASNFGSATNVTGVNATGSNVNAVLTQVANANTTHIIDIYRPTERYVRLNLTASVNSVLHGAVAIRYRRAGILPATQSAEKLVRVRMN